MENQLHDRTGRTFSDIRCQFREIRSVCIIFSRTSAGLLETDVVPVFVSDTRCHGELAFLGLDTIHNLAVSITCRIVHHILVMPLQSAPADIEIPYDSIDSGSIEKFPKVLFYGILGETVSDGQYLDHSVAIEIRPFRLRFRFRLWLRFRFLVRIIRVLPLICLLHIFRILFFCISVRTGYKGEQHGRHNHDKRISLFHIISAFQAYYI